MASFSSSGFDSLQSISNNSNQLGYELRGGNSPRRRQAVSGEQDIMVTSGYDAVGNITNGYESNFSDSYDNLPSKFSSLNLGNNNPATEMFADVRIRASKPKRTQYLHRSTRSYSSPNSVRGRKAPLTVINMEEEYECNSTRLVQQRLANMSKNNVVEDLDNVSHDRRVCNNSSYWSNTISPGLPFLGYAGEPKKSTGFSKQRQRSKSFHNSIPEPSKSNRGPPPIPKSKTRESVKSARLIKQFGTKGSESGQFNQPHGFCLGDDDDIIVADTENHRIQFFSKDGDFIGSFGKAGQGDGQLWHPRKVAYLPKSWVQTSQAMRKIYFNSLGNNYPIDGVIVVCDKGAERSRMQLFDRKGKYIKKIDISYAEIVAGISTTPEGNIVIVDSVKPTVYEITVQGEMKFWMKCEQMTEPSAVCSWGERYFVCDFKAHKIFVYERNTHLLGSLGGPGVTDFPSGVDVLTDAGGCGTIYVSDSHGNRQHVTILRLDSECEGVIADYEISNLNVTRSCGMGVMKDGKMVTVSKQGNFVIKFALDEPDTPYPDTPDNRLRLVEQKIDIAPTKVL